LDRWRFTFASPSVERLLGFRPEEFIALTLRELLTPAAYELAARTLADELAAEQAEDKDLGRQRMLELEHVTKGGAPRWCEVTTAFLRDAQNRVTGILGVTRDISQRKKDEAALQKERELLQQLIELHERDRQMIAYEIHDGVAQQLTGLKFNLEAFAQVQRPESEPARKTFDAALHLLGRSIEESRRLISGLRPPVLDELGVVAAVDYLVCERHADAGPEIEFVHNVHFDRLAPPLEAALFRIAQESLANACRHSGSPKVRLELVEREDRVRFSTRDWGVGFNPKKVKEGCFGLRGIRERARLLGGKARIKSAPGKGTQVTVELPLVASLPKKGEG
jgi:PAS domain S-box-containing protein